MRRAAIAVTAFAAFALLAGCSGAPPTKPLGAVGRIDGAVVDQVLHPYANLTVHLVNLGRTDVTNSLGGFSFVGVPPGTYTLTAEAPGATSDVKVVEVRPGAVSRLFLQLIEAPVSLPHVTSLKNHGQADLAVPDSDCSACAWSTYVMEKPLELVVRAVWDPVPAGQDHLRITVEADGAAVLGRAEGTSPLEVSIPAAALPDAPGRYTVRIHFQPGFVPRPFEMESFADLYYGQARPQTA